MVNWIKAFFKLTWGVLVFNLAAKFFVFVFLVAVMLWLGINILRVGGGQGLIAAGPLNGAALPAIAAASSTKSNSAPAKPAATDSGTKRVDQKAGAPRPQPSTKPAEGAASEAEKSATPGQEGQSKKNSEEARKESSNGTAALPPSFEQMTVLAALCGALGATLHALGSLVAFVGNGRFVASWTLWYLAQPIRGAVLACGVYWASYGDLLSPSAASNASAGLGLMFMVGLFSDPALEKLREVFLVLFRTGTKLRTDPLESGRKPVIAKARVVTAAGGAATVEIDGGEFEAGDEVTINGDKQKILSQTAKALAVELPAKLVVQGSKLELVVRPTEKGSSASAASFITVP